MLESPRSLLIAARSLNAASLRCLWACGRRAMATKHEGYDGMIHRHKKKNCKEVELKCFWLIKRKNFCSSACHVWVGEKCMRDKMFTSPGLFVADTPIHFLTRGQPELPATPGVVTRFLVWCPFPCMCTHTNLRTVGWTTATKPTAKCFFSSSPSSSSLYGGSLHLSTHTAICSFAFEDRE